MNKLKKLGIFGLVAGVATAAAMAVNGINEKNDAHPEKEVRVHTRDKTDEVTVKLNDGGFYALSQGQPKKDYFTRSLKAEFKDGQLNRDNVCVILSYEYNLDLPFNTQHSTASLYLDAVPENIKQLTREHLKEAEAGNPKYAEGFTLGTNEACGPQVAEKYSAALKKATDAQAKEHRFKFW